MSKQFLFFECVGCNCLFRNRQKLFRHKKTCEQFLSRTADVVLESIPSIEIEMESGDDVELLSRELQEYDLNSEIKSYVKDRSLQCIVSGELQGNWFIFLTVRYWVLGK
jgi:hypothetical protein